LKTGIAGKNSRREEKGTHQAEIKFKTEEHKTRFADGKARRQGLSEGSL